MVFCGHWSHTNHFVLLQNRIKGVSVPGSQYSVLVKMAG